jgi:uncharacterized protein DUF4336
MADRNSKPLMLIQLSENIWTVGGSHKFAGMEFGTRMTVIRLSTGALLLHSPVRINNVLRGEIDSLGEVKFIVAPNKFHHLRIKDCKDLYPGAELWGAPGLAKKRKDIEFEGEINDKTCFGLEGELEHFIFNGMPAVNEAVFYHPESKTLILTDLLFNFPKDLSPGFKLFLRLFGIYGGPRVDRLVRYVFLKDREKARDSARKILSLDFDRVLLAHKDIIPSGGKEIVRKAFECFGI